MAKEKKQKQINLEEITALTKELFHAHYAGDLERWFDYLCPDSIYLGTGEPMLFGGSAIREHFKGFEGERSILKMDMNTTRFVRNLLLEQPAGRRIAFPSGNQTVYVNPYTILYAKSRDKRTELVCVDRVVSCNYIYRELKERLPEVFYPLRRGYLVNTLYIVALRRFEAELISGISIPIPALTYTQVKRDLQELIEKNNGRKAGSNAYIHAKTQKGQAMPVLIHSARRGKNPAVISPPLCLPGAAPPNPFEHRISFCGCSFCERFGP